MSDFYYNANARNQYRQVGTLIEVTNNIQKNFRDLVLISMVTYLDIDTYLISYLRSFLEICKDLGQVYIVKQVLKPHEIRLDQVSLCVTKVGKQPIVTNMLFLSNYVVRVYCLQSEKDSQKTSLVNSGLYRWIESKVRYFIVIFDRN